MSALAVDPEKTVQRLLCPSMMCARFDNLAQETQILDESGADIFHLDVMDGRFVHNYGLGLGDVQCIRRHTKKPVDVHLMVEKPSETADIFLDLGIDILYIHAETDPHLARTLAHIRERGCRAGLALNPGTSLEMVECVLPLVDYLMFMTVNPGFAGQAYLPFVERKITKAAEWKKEYGFRIAVDGAISHQTIERLGSLGAEVFVLGTSALFGKGGYREILQALHTR